MEKTSDLSNFALGMIAGVTAVVGERRRGPRCSVVHVHDLLITLNTRTKITKQNKRNRKQLPTPIVGKQAA
jgi:hypothetical protein